MKQILRNIVPALLLLTTFTILVFPDAAAQGHNHSSSSNVYRGSYQRFATGPNSTNSYEIRGGALYAWGGNYGGQLGNAGTSDQLSPIQVGSDTKWTNVVAGSSYTAALKSDGTLWACGFNGTGQVGTGSTSGYQGTMSQIGTDNKWVSISANNATLIALKSNGTLWALGSNSNGQLGDGTRVDQYNPEQIGGDTSWASIATGSNYTMALKVNGTLWGWGKNTNGQLGDASTTDSYLPEQIGLDSTWTNVAAGSSHTVALKSNGTLWAWGLNSNGQLGDTYLLQQNSPEKIGSDTTWTGISCGDNFTMALKSRGTLWGWGANDHNKLGDGTTTEQHSPERIGGDTIWVAVAGGSVHTMALKSNGSIWAWGGNGNGQLGDGTTSGQTMPEQIRNATNDWLSVSNGNSHTMALKSDGTLWAWGNNGNGQLGDGSNADKHTREQIGLDNRWVSVVAGSGHTVALKCDGTLWAWGSNGNGQLGDGTTADKWTPVQVGTDTNWTSISTGASHTLALKTNGSLWAWGNNGNGQIGDGTTGTQRYSPVQIGTDTKWTAILGGAAFTVALKAVGTLWAWGSNSIGQLGIGTTIDNPNPQKIGTDNKWVSITTGNYFTAALKSNGSLWEWGANTNSQLGDGTTTEQHSPEMIGSDNKWCRLSAAANMITAFKSDGSLWAWGNNTYGQLGNGTTSNVTTPTQVNGQSNVVGLDKGGTNFYSAVIKSDRSNICMVGSNSNGQLGDGTTSSNSYYNCASSNSLLPIKLVSFTANKESVTSNRINWNVALETPNTVYEITRSSNGIAFSTIGSVTSTGSTATYTFFDNQPFEGNNYYRLKMVEEDGETSYSNIVVISGNKNGSSVIIAPIPATTTVTVTNADATMNGKPVSITDMQGRDVYRFIMNTVTMVDVHNWPAGIYMLRLPNGKTVRLMKL